MNYSLLGWAGFIIVLAIMSVSAYYLFLAQPDLSPDENSHVECINNSCVLIKGTGVNECSSPGSFCGCLDTDISSEFPDGSNPNERGTTRNSEDSKTDLCSVFGDTLTEYICQGNEIIETQIDCTLTPGLVCQKGRCLPEEEAYNECIDSDDGSNYFETGSASQAHRTVQDYCRNQEILGEIICDEEQKTILVELVDCSTLGDYKCRGGACVPIE
jgi:hypothetical protein